MVSQIHLGGDDWLPRHRPIRAGYARSCLVAAAPVSGTAGDRALPNALRGATPTYPKGVMMSRTAAQMTANRHSPHPLQASEPDATACGQNTDAPCLAETSTSPVTEPVPLPPRTTAPAIPLPDPHVTAKHVLQGRALTGTQTPQNLVDAQPVVMQRDRRATGTRWPLQAVDEAEPAHVGRTPCLSRTCVDALVGVGS
ncbi:hypothetical protein GCM10023336_67340 [Streptomyces similanensis]|uniref:Uncharacterized protein n=1 Tax=Streptomyces similanensis TaxID=1274988 RepID=A0ABP9LJ02_9ACTN